MEKSLCLRLSLNTNLVSGLIQREAVYTLVTSSCFLDVHCSFFDVNVKI